MIRTVKNRATLKVLSLATAGLLAPSLAMAGFTLGDTMPSTEDALRAALSGQGYVVEEIEIDDGMLEVEVTKDGIEYELVIKPDTGELVEIEQERDDD
jgi:uncharacterized membrane protein YkoI